MIIKKKYANTIQKSSTSEQEVIEEIENFSPEEAVDDFSAAEDVNEVNGIEPEVIEEAENSEPKPFSLDLSIDDLTFEQRPERREGSRRRGYRRTQDRNIVSRAQKEAQTIKEAAKQDGYKEGINQANRE